MGKLDELETFVKVVEVESFSEAARQLGISKSYVSKHISRLEDRLGARLLNRTTRQLTLTDVGARFYERCVSIIEQLEEAQVEVADLQSAARGTLRVSVPMSFGIRHLAPAVAQFMRQHSELTVEMMFSDRPVNIVDEGFDVAVRIGVLKDSSLHARKLATTRSVTVASPDYVERRGAPRHPSELKEHACLRYTYLSSGTMWRYLDAQGQEFSVKIDGPMLTNNGDANFEAACAGVGVATLPDFFVNEALEDGRLVRLFEDWSHPLDLGIWALYPHNRHLSAKVRLFVDFLVETFSVPRW